MAAYRWALLITASVVLCGAACHRARAVQVQASTEPADDSVFVEVINDNYYDVRVHVIYQGGARHSVGTIAGNTRHAAVAIPWQPRALVVEIALIVGTGIYQSDAVDVTAGDVVEVRIPPNLDVSGFFRRVGKLDAGSRDSLAWLGSRLHYMSGIPILPNPGGGMDQISVRCVLHLQRNIIIPGRCSR